MKAICAEHSMSWKRLFWVILYGSALTEESIAVLLKGVKLDMMPLSTSDVIQFQHILKVFELMILMLRFTGWQKC